ncbi:MAG: UvrD-helicase domain-containing protein [Erysipelotrichaceae bacterium]|nr:UvrD-helicase domain-containing protein [Erysipelotrichaceae bacterium]
MSDIDARKRIISDVNRNFFVEAGAGSGKTTVLVERMVGMVEKGIPVEKICTITFTKAAANEFYERFQRRLIERSRIPEEYEEMESRLPKPTEETVKLCQIALQNIDLCFMGTIDSFCNMVLSEHPAEARIPSDARIISDEEMTAIFMQEYSEIMRGNYGEKLQDLCSRFVKTRSNAPKVFAVMMNALYASRDADFVFNDQLEDSADKAFAVEKKALCAALRVMESNPDLAYEKGVLGKTGKPSESDTAWEDLMNKGSYLRENWEDRFTNIPYLIKDFKKIRILEVDNIEDYFKEVSYLLRRREGRLHCYEFDQEYLDILLQKLNDYQSRIALCFIRECLDQIPERLRKEGKLSFFDYKIYLRDMLREDARKEGKLIRHIYRRHSYFLIDEFQDTDPMQAQIFFYLSGKDIDPDWKKCIPYPGSLFIVGDPKQSIYRFKNADVTSFQRVHSLFNGEVGEVLKLTSNFRSTTLLHKWFNQVFSLLLDEDTKDQSRFELIPIVEKEDKGVTGVYSYVANTGTKAEPEEKDDCRVLEIVRKLVGNDGVQIPDDNGNLRSVTYRDIMIITKTKPAIEKYTKIFTENGIPFRVEGSIDFNECPALMELIDLYNYVSDPGNNLYLYGALNSGIYRNEDLSSYLDVLKNPELIQEKEGDAVLDDLYDLTQRARELSPAALFALLIEKTQIFRIVGTGNLEYVYYVLELLRKAEQTKEITSHKEAREYLEQLCNGDLKPERYASLEKSTDRIHIANLHKVKGLEANIVILANPDQRSRKPQKRVEYEEEKPQCFVFNIYDGFTPVLSLNENGEKLAEEMLSAEAEELRLLYVAATRAKRILIVSKGTGKNDPWERLSMRIGEDFFDAFKDVKTKTPAEFETLDGSKLYQKAMAENVIANTKGEESLIHLMAPSRLEHQDYMESGTPFKKRDPALIGTLVHRLMEMTVLSKNQLDMDETIQDLTKGLDQDDSYYSDILHGVYEKIQNGGYVQENDVPQDILGVLLDADEVFCELPFSYKEDEKTMWNGTMDVVYRKDDRWHIVDYKTNADPNDLDEKYREQLNAYVKAFRQMTGNEVDALIYHIDV